MTAVLTHNQVHKTPQDALTHFGVKGMKWGVTTKGKPAGNEKRAERHDAKADKAQVQIDKIMAKTTKWKIVQDSRDQTVSQLKDVRDLERKNAADIRGGRKLTDAQRQALIGAGVVGGLLAAYGAYTYLDSGQFQQARVNRNEQKTGEKFAWAKNNKLTGRKTEAQIMNDIVKPINPGFGEPGTKMNCRRCTFAYEMRRRGNDVKATKSISGTGQTAPGVVNAMTPGSTLKTGRYGILLSAMREADKGGPMTDALSTVGLGKKDVESTAWFSQNTPTRKTTAIFASLDKYPDGARGELGMKWNMGGGHSMAWERVSGKTIIFDAQSGKSYTRTNFDKLTQNMAGAGHTRLDNVTMNDEFLKRWLQNAD